ncbi:hypothetical protein EV126DRAFT_411858 [Verticillium dahliae]|nr:hypothetical protein EV126DRAFT_411858 [Verticillium dahliae]
MSNRSCDGFVKRLLVTRVSIHGTKHSSIQEVGQSSIRTSGDSCWNTTKEDSKSQQDESQPDLDSALHSSLGPASTWSKTRSRQQANYRTGSSYREHIPTLRATRPTLEARPIARQRDSGIQIAGPANHNAHRRQEAAQHQVGGKCQTASCTRLWPGSESSGMKQGGLGLGNSETCGRRRVAASSRAPLFEDGDDVVIGLDWMEKAGQAFAKGTCFCSLDGMGEKN